MIKSRIRIAALSSLLCVIGTTTVIFALPSDEDNGETISYTGYLEMAGSPASGPVDLRFRLFGTESGGMEVWPLAEDGSATVNLSSGRFTVELGGHQMSSLPPEAFTAPELWLEVSVEGTRLGGRQRVGTSRYAVHATDAVTSGFATLAGNGAPPGTIVAYGGATAPPGWLVCDGSAVSSADYPGLFAAIGTAWGAGSGPDTDFHLPDLRGRFLRGVDNAAGRDRGAASREASNAGGNTGDSVGTVQGHATARPSNPFQVEISDANTDGGDSNCIDTGEVCQSPLRRYTVSRGGDPETRPVNAAATFIIKM